MTGFDTASMLIGIVLLLVVAVIFYILGKRAAQEKAKEYLRDSEKNIRSDAIERSKRTTLGHAFERIAPYTIDFPYLPNDVQFIGKPIDFIVFEGWGEKEIKRIVFLEVKTGKSQLTKQERQVRDAIQNGRVEWQVHRLNEAEKTKV